MGWCVLQVSIPTYHWLKKGLKTMPRVTDMIKCLCVIIAGTMYKLLQKNLLISGWKYVKLFKTMLYYRERYNQNYIDRFNCYHLLWCVYSFNFCEYLKWKILNLLSLKKRSISICPHVAFIPSLMITPARVRSLYLFYMLSFPMVQRTPTSSNPQKQRFFIECLQRITNNTQSLSIIVVLMGTFSSRMMSAKITKNTQARRIY